jgi:hypothetical protein
MDELKLKHLQETLQEGGFDYSKNYREINCREHPELYKIGKGEQGVLTVEPYKSEILPHWKFKNTEIAQKSSEKIYEMFLAYKKDKDFIGMDMARKFLQMGYTRSRRYANHKSGKKYDGPVPEGHKGESGAHGRAILKDDPDEEKALCARIFYAKWDLARKDEEYLNLKLKHQSINNK